MWGLLALLPVANAFFFGGGSSCGCGAPPACPPPAPAPLCAPALPPACPQQSCGGGGYGSFSQQPSFSSFPQQAPFQPLASVGNNYASAPIVSGGFPQQVPQQAPSFAPQSLPQAPEVQQTPFAPQQIAPAAPQPIYQPQAVAQPQSFAPAGGETYQPQAQPQSQQQPVAPAVPAGQYQEAPAAPAQAVQPAQQTQENYQVAATEVQPSEQTQPEETSEYKEESNVSVSVAAASKNAEVIEEASDKTKTEGKTEKDSKNDKGGDKVIDISQLKLSDDPLCNSDDLRNLMLENMDDNLNSSKRLIQLAAEAQFGGRFDVICANGDFSYVTNTELYCQETKGDVSCYTYRQL